MQWVDRYATFRTREEAERFCAQEHSIGNKHAFVSTLNSHMMTSASTPIVVNVRGRKIGCGCCVGPENDRCCCHMHQDIRLGLPAKICSFHCR